MYSRNKKLHAWFVEKKSFGVQEFAQGSKTEANQARRVYMQQVSDAQFAKLAALWSSSSQSLSNSLGKHVSNKLAWLSYVLSPLSISGPCDASRSRLFNAMDMDRKLTKQYNSTKSGAVCFTRLRHIYGFRTYSAQCNTNGEKVIRLGKPDHC